MWKDKIAKGKIIESETKFGEFRLVVHHFIYRPPDAWLATCPGLFNMQNLASKDMGEAKCQAKAILQVILKDALKEILDE